MRSYGLAAPVLLVFSAAPACLAQGIAPSGMEAAPLSDLPELESALRTDDWNARVHAVAELRTMGPPALGALAYALDDADWQVRLAAVHALGRLGRPGLPALSGVLAEEPCRVVRLTALHWIASLGPEALPLLEENSEDESAVVRVVNGYWIRKLTGRPFAEEPDPELAEDLNRCVASPKPGRRETPPANDDGRGALRHAAETPATTPEHAIASVALRRRKDAALQKKRELELDAIIGLPEAPEGPAGTEARLETPPERTPPSSEIDGSLPAGGPGSLEAPEAIPPRAEASVSPPAEIVPEKKGPPFHDARPALLEALRSDDPRVRSRAADQIGDYGPEAGAAVGPLMLAMTDDSARVRASAALALGNIGPAAAGAVPLLERALDDKSPAVRFGAAAALGRVGTPAARKAFARYLRDEVRKPKPGP